ncbi:hypothetical protein EOA27_01270 [Mesorhizobium sp. M2A.F.Ca.ET.037.01.1.1]|uniref:hypothetical protein n=1 Tax=unclassified Mesorhizobium TaxID=325217 RepID=UPI000F75C0F1|nr:MULTISPECIES: hypothetical protein [unclassified Mesorhizobium]RUY13047.1 hypothetical protein EOA25_01545 [Mesorhizobium sp. M2A.F.Ca.ET.040.01.1.1]RVC69295.1 hypothetical protein EN759_08545 [Mesorhizobium sp. M00.F.Ca.ET.038.03.1.1]RVC82454.1 hypothetical protein EN766_00995 [Mesorhizobium sp. M2A.F.Ca.ET.046.02.1.1]AZO35266.1 hypothetical protein EJ072_12900 [Mesorhizobium sp. M2A.F.Ca.ET.046.03.2.1]RUX23220.1 hypothetical protein EOA27_01270 [Mesorhizobium sp. M2A.F.Ca.ET.037.01.1.1]
MPWCQQLTHRDFCHEARIQRQAGHADWPAWRAYADAFDAELLIRCGDPKHGLAVMYSALTKLRAAGFVLYDMAFRGVVAAGLVAVGDNVGAAAELDLALAQCAKTGEGWCLPELQRIRAELYAAVGERDAGKRPAAASF